MRPSVADVQYETGKVVSFNAEGMGRSATRKAVQGSKGTPQRAEWWQRGTETSQWQ